MTQKNKITIIGISGVLTGSILVYFQGYKESSLFNLLCYGFILLGWATFVFSIVAEYIFDNNVKYKVNKSKWLSQIVIRTAIFIAFVGLSFGNSLLVDNLADYRISEILNNEPTKITNAKVTNLESRNSRGGPLPYAIIQYSTDNGIIVHSLFNKHYQFSVGQVFEIKYSVDYPEMYVIIRRIE